MNPNLSTQQFQQLAMFSPAHELMKIPGDFSASDTHGWDHKLSEAKQPMDITYGRRKPKGPSLQDSIRQNGIHWPVHVRLGDAYAGSFINDGHHRVAAAHDIDPNYLVPVQYSELRPKRNR